MSYSTNALLNEPKIQALKLKLDRTIKLAVEKAAGHMQDPNKYPLPGNPKSLERAFHSLLTALPNKSKKKLFEHVNLSLNASTSARNTTYGELAAINLKNTTAVLDQVAAMPVPAAMKMTADEIEEIIKKREPKLKVPAKRNKQATEAPVPHAIAAGTVAFFVDTLTCNKKSEISKDEITLETIVTNGLAEPQTLAPIDLGKFKKGDSKAVSANPLFNFDIIEDSTGTAQNLSALLFLREKDLIGNIDLAKKLSLIILVIALALSLLALGIAIVGTLLALTSQALFDIMVASFFTSLGLGPIGFHVIPLLADDLSTVATDDLLIDSTIQVGDVVNRSVAFELKNSDADLTKGNYTAALRWVKTS